MPSVQPTKTYAYVWDGALLYAPRSLSNTRHAHFPATVLIAVNKPFALTIEGERRYYEVAVLAPNAERETDSEGEPLVDFLIDPDDDAYRFLHPLFADHAVVRFDGERLAAMRQRLSAVFEGQLKCAEAHRLVRDVLSALSPQPLAQLPWDQRLQGAMAYMRERIKEDIPSVAEISRHVELSESRFSHLFRSQLGLPVRQYLLWLRIRHAMRLWAQGKSLSEIALGAGFYDHAHFTKTLRRMTDYAPSMLTDPASVARCDCTGGP